MSDVDCVVLGADGFIGSHLTEALAARGQRVRAFDRFPDGVPRNLQFDECTELMQGDFLNRSDLAAAVAGAEYVFHFVSTTTPATSAHDPLVDVETNLRMTVELLQLCAAARVRRVIFPSTGGAVYGRGRADPFSEDDRADPISPYAICKLAIEGYLRFFHQAHRLDYLALRIGNPYGERQNIVGSQGVIPIMLNRLYHGEPLTVIGDGSMVRDYVYIDDLVEMIVRVFDRRTRHRLYNLGSGRGVSVSEIVEAIATTTGETPKIERLPDRPTDAHRVVMDVSRFVDEFGTTTATTLEEGIARTWAYVRSLSEDPLGAL